MPGLRLCVDVARSYSDFLVDVALSYKQYYESNGGAILLYYHTHRSIPMYNRGTTCTSSQSYSCTSTTNVYKTVLV